MAKTTKTVKASGKDKADLDAMLESGDKPKKPAAAPKKKEQPKKEQPKAHAGAEKKRAEVKAKLAAEKEAAKQAKPEKPAKKAQTEQEKEAVTTLKPHHLITDAELRKEMQRFAIDGEVEKNEDGVLVATLYLGNQFVELPAAKEVTASRWLRTMYNEVRAAFDAEVSVGVKKATEPLAKRIEELEDENDKLRVKAKKAAA